MAQLSACLDTSIIVSLDILQLGACSDALTYSMSSCCRCLDSGIGAIRKSFDVQVIFCPLTSPPVVTLYPSYNAIIIPSLLNSDIS